MGRTYGVMWKTHTHTVRPPRYRCTHGSSTDSSYKTDIIWSGRSYLVSYACTGVCSRAHRRQVTKIIQSPDLPCTYCSTNILYVTTTAVRHRWHVTWYSWHKSMYIHTPCMAGDYDPQSLTWYWYSCNTRYIISYSYMENEKTTSRYRYMIKFSTTHSVLVPV